MQCEICMLNTKSLQIYVLKKKTFQKVELHIDILCMANILQVLYSNNKIYHYIMNDNFFMNINLFQQQQ